jgi:hypothetical protein
MKKISVNKNEYNLINNDERYSNLLNNLKNKGITLVIKDNAPDTFIIKKDVKIVFGDNTQKKFSSFEKLTNNKGQKND